MRNLGPFSRTSRGQAAHGWLSRSRPWRHNRLSGPFWRVRRNRVTFLVRPSESVKKIWTEIDWNFDRITFFYSFWSSDFFQMFPAFCYISFISCWEAMHLWQLTSVWISERSAPVTRACPVHHCHCKKSSDGSNTTWMCIPIIQSGQ